MFISYLKVFIEMFSIEFKKDKHLYIVSIPSPLMQLILPIVSAVFGKMNCDVTVVFALLKRLAASRKFQMPYPLKL